MPTVWMEERTISVCHVAINEGLKKFDFFPLLSEWRSAWHKVGEGYSIGRKNDSCLPHRLSLAIVKLPQAPATRAPSQMPSSDVLKQLGRES
ncbi:hypothetical protein CBOM_07570 [Ceraceosorus bombacis]|uniref:Uncharacterized protein n=1 Tax=Ceraceosorus bombacis TaxID=401625 RepID=A0A0P1BFL0_9BASI|nr:hypothetical protein CBOM_07570 [Ceraceosorus bombacis]